MLTVASYNIRKAVGTDRRRDPHRVIEVLHEIDADIVALQEADRRFGARQAALPLDILDDSPYTPVPFGIRPGGLGWHGNAILVRRGIEVTGFHALHLPVLEPRGAVMAELRIDGSPLRIIGMHLDLSGLWRRRQVRSVLDHVRACAGAMPTILMGDLNEWSHSGGCLREFDGYRILGTGRSFHSRRPIASLDRIIVGPGVDVADCGVHHSPKASLASDHLPIWAKIAL